MKTLFSLRLMLLLMLPSGMLYSFNVDTLYICKNSCIVYTNVTTAGNAIAWEWTFQGGTPGTSNQQNPSAVCYPNAGVYLTTVKTTFDNNQDTTDSVHVVVFDDPMPAFSFPSDTGYCSSTTFSLTLNTISYPGVQYTWSTGAKSSSITVNNPGTYWVDLVMRAGNNVCDSVRKQVTVTAYPDPVADLGEDILMCQNQLITLDAGQGQGYTYQWQPGGEVTGTIGVSLPGVYSVRVTNQFGCFQTDQIELKDSCPHLIYVPNAVSPNSDRLNDLFVKVWNFTPKDYSFRIYNRWGELLWETTDLEEGWDCTFNGGPVQQDVYIYKISYFDTDKKWYELRGTFYVVR